MTLPQRESVAHNRSAAQLELDGTRNFGRLESRDRGNVDPPQIARSRANGKRCVLMSQHIHQIQCVVADASGITVLDLRSPRRSRALAHTRQLAMWLCRHLTPASLPEIGRAFGDRDHTTVMHAIAVTERRMAADAAFAQQAMGIAERIDLEQTDAVRRAMA